MKTNVIAWVLPLALLGCGTAASHALRESAHVEDNLFGDEYCAASPAERARLRGEMRGEMRPDERVRAILTHCGTSDAVSLTTDLVRFQTVNEVAPAAEHPAFARMAEYLRLWCEQRGLRFRVVGDSDALEIELPAEGDDADRGAMFVAHGDVVPVNEPAAPIGDADVPLGWTVPPFLATVRDGKLFGRGTIDDKGPIAAALVAMAAMREADVALDEAVVLAIGLGEESDWDGMRRYAAQAPPARNVVSIDADFPVVTAEAGFVAWQVEVPTQTSAASASSPLPTASRARRAVPQSPPRPATLPTILSATGGLFLTQVPAQAEMVLAPPPGGDADALTRELSVRATQLSVAARHGTFLFEVSRVPQGVRVVASGKSIHSSRAEEGHNPLWALAELAAATPHAESAAATMLAVIERYFLGDHEGLRIGLRYEDAQMGPLVVAPTLLRTEGTRVTLGVNMRRPRGQTSAQFTAHLQEALGRMRTAFPTLTQSTGEDASYVGEPHVVPTPSPLVDALLDVYRRVTGDANARATSERGGTYARLFPGAVSFGPGWPGQVYAGHAADESIALDVLGKCVTLYGEAILALVPRASAHAAVR